MNLTTLLSVSATTAMGTTVKTINYGCTLELEDGADFFETWTTEDDSDAVIIEIEEWIEETLENEDWEVYEVITTRQDGNCWTSVAYDDEGEVIARGTIEGDEY